MAKVLGIVHGCNGCPHKSYYSGGRYECNKVRVLIPENVIDHPLWCPLPDHPANIISDLERGLADSMAKFDAKADEEETPTRTELLEWIKAEADTKCHLCDGSGLFYGNVSLCSCVNSARYLKTGDSSDVR